MAANTKLSLTPAFTRFPIISCALISGLTRVPYNCAISNAEVSHEHCSEFQLA